MVHLPYPLLFLDLRGQHYAPEREQTLKHRHNLQFIAAPYHMMPAVHPYGTPLLLQLLQLKGMAAGWKLTEQGGTDVRGSFCSVTVAIHRQWKEQFMIN